MILCSLVPLVKSQTKPVCTGTQGQRSRKLEQVLCTTQCRCTSRTRLGTRTDSCNSSKLGMLSMMSTMSMMNTLSTLDMMSMHEHYEHDEHDESALSSLAEHHEHDEHAEHAVVGCIPAIAFRSIDSMNGIPAILCLVGSCVLYTLCLVSCIYMYT